MPMANKTQLSTALVPANEPERLEELYALQLLDTAAEERFDRYTRLAADLFNVPIALISLVDKDRQWFKSACGLTLSETPREVSFCAHAILGRDVLVVPDAAADSRFADNPLVTGEPHIRFYAGAVIRGRSGQPLGTCCIIDREPRTLSAREERQLAHLGRLVEKEMQTRLELAELRTQIREQALYDSATGLPNQALVRDRLDSAIATSEHTGGGFLLAHIRVDRFGALEDALGRFEVSRALGRIGVRLGQALGPDSMVGRWQDDELALFSPLQARPSASEEAISKVLECFDAPVEMADRTVPLRASIGAAVCPDDGAKAEELVAKARAALRANPVHGQSRYRFYTGELKNHLVRRFEIEAGLRTALGNDELHLVFQPKIELRAGRICGMEALMRWRSPTLGAVSPVEFIPVAEQNGLIIELGDWALRSACEQIRAWGEAGLRPIPVGVNITSFQLRQPDFKSRVREMLESAAIAGELLDFEVTESSLVDDIEGAIDIMRDMGELGITFSIDDFGTGFSSLSYLRKMPIQQLKIDRSFINEMTSNVVDATIAQSVIALAHGLGLKAVAEGVETREQLTFLRAYRCDELQGYLFSPPVDAEQFSGLLAEDRRLEF